MYFSKDDILFELSTFLMHICLWGMWKGKDYCILDMLFSFCPSFISLSNGLDDQVAMTKWQTMYWDLTQFLKDCRGHRDWSTPQLTEICDIARQLTEILKAMSDRNCETALYTLKFHQEHHIVETTKRFETLELVDALPFETFPVYIKRVYRI